VVSLGAASRSDDHKDSGAGLSGPYVSGQHRNSPNQLVGGCAQGLGGALLEEFVYDDNGEPLSATFADYLMPMLHDMPDVEVLLTEDAPSPRHPLGLKGAGEGGINGAGGVIASAIDDAIGMPGAVTRLPVTPQRMRELLRKRVSSE